MSNIVSNKREKNQILRRAIVIVILDILVILAAEFLSLWIGYEFSFRSIERIYMDNAITYTPINVLSTIAVFYIFHLYTSLWKYASVAELSNVVFATVTASILQIIGMTAMDLQMPRSYWMLYMMILLIATSGIRFFYRFARYFRNMLNPKKLDNVMIIGAGDAGAAVLKEIHLSKKYARNVCCMIDDNPTKQGRYIQGCPVIGGRDKIQEAVEKYAIGKIIIAMPAAKKSEVKEILEICKTTKCELSILPGTYQIINGDVSLSQLRNVEIEDLLGRDPIKVNLDEILGYVQGKVVMITGGGGSIGSELSRQIASHNPKRLILVDIYENNVYDIQLELKRKYPNLDLVVLIASVRNTERINKIFETYRPQIVYHAAAHKHVPLMEDSPNEAIKNNVFGTYKTALAAGRNGVEKFVLISTDKAVNPTNIMGASKRMCEMIVQTLNNQFKTEFVAVRFGNVLGSNGSVIPLFKRQIAEGGPVTVTHPDIIRYFMTIPEAVSLVLQAGAYAKGGEIFILDMGEPMKILDLAKNLIQLSGYTVDEDIKIEFTGLRSGEKLYEELLMAEEGMKDTENKMIHIGHPIEFDEELFMKQLAELKEACYHESDRIKELVAEVVTTYQYGKNKKNEMQE